MSNRMLERTIGKVKKYFLELPQPDAVLQFTARSLFAIRLSPKDRAIRQRCAVPVSPGSILPSFDRTNLAELPHLEERLEEAKKVLQLQEGSVAVLLPELCFKVAIFNSDSPSLSQTEMEKMVWWRVRKLMPLLPDDARLSYEVVASQSSEKILASLARSSVIQEYENLLARKRLRAGAVMPPSLNLLSLLIRGERNAEDSIIVNIEDDAVSLLAVINSEISLYRVKPFMHEGRSLVPHEEKMDNIVKEVENTIHFIEDREKKKISHLWVRRGLMEKETDFVSVLKTRFSFPVESVETLVPFDLPSREKEVLSTLVGQFL